MISAGVGYEAFNTKYLVFTPESLIYSVAGNLVGPLINRTAIRADYQNANARQLQAIYSYQQVVINAFTEVINRINMVENYTKSIEIKKQQLDALEASVAAAANLFQNVRVEYMDVLFAQRDLIDARMVLIETKKEQLSALVNTYQALGGGLVPLDYPGSTFVADGIENALPGAVAEAAPPELIPAQIPSRHKMQSNREIVQRSFSHCHRFHGERTVVCAVLPPSNLESPRARVNPPFPLEDSIP